VANIRKASKISINETESYTPRNEKEKFLVKAFLALKTEKEMANFLRDLLTLPEIEEFANRLEIVRLLFKGESYKEIADETKVSTTTVSRVSHWLFSGTSGYYKVISKLQKRK
jgi:TrpR-related protein YerC/YecD